MTKKALVALACVLLASAALTAVTIGAAAGPGLLPGRPGGVLNVLTREDLTQGFSIHESVTLSTIWPAQPCFNNLVTFDPVKPLETFDTVIPELAEKWSWQDGYRNLVLFLRHGVKWHDGQPFTSKDVKFTFDMVREAADATGKLRVNPRKDWYGNVEAIETPDAYTVVFHLKRPQPSLLLMLASGDSPVYPAHVPPAEQRVRCVGTGPFKLKEWKRGEYVDYVKNPDYFVKGRPYLDGIRYLIVTERGTRTAALQAGRADAASPLDSSPQMAAQLRAAVPGMVITRVGAGNADNLLLNITKPPFNDARVRKALSRAVDRQAFIKTVLQGSGTPGGAMAPRPDRLLGAGRRRPRPGQRQGGGAAAPRRRRLHGVESAPRRDGDAQPRHLSRHGLLRPERAQAGRRGGDPALHRHRGVVRDRLAQGLPDRGQYLRLRHRRPRLQLLRALHLPVGAQLHGLL